MSRIALDVRRVGGLEVQSAAQRDGRDVVRRVGGLEVGVIERLSHPCVVRRVGGLEVHPGLLGFAFRVVRRVGGLEGLIEESFIMRFPFLTRRRWNGRNGRSRNSPL